MARDQKDVLDREVRKFQRRRLVKYHDLEQDLLREVDDFTKRDLIFKPSDMTILWFQELNKRQSQCESAHSMLMRHHELTHELETKQQRAVHNLREDHVSKQHQTELNNQVGVHITLPYSHTVVWCGLLFVGLCRTINCKKRFNTC